MAVTVAVVICAHTMERLELTAKCVMSVLSGSLEPTELLIVIDNNRELEAALQRRTFRREVTIQPNGGRGAADARTTGIRVSTSEIIAFIDDDAWAEERWLEELVAAFEDPSVVGAGGLVVPDWGPNARPLPDELLWIVGSTYKGHPVGRRPITRPIGANMAARRLALLQAGGFPSAFGPKEGRKLSSNEELALFSYLTARFGENSVYFIPSAVVHHYAPVERTTWAYLLSRSWAEGISKADARVLMGTKVMAYDSSYVTATLLPGTANYIRKSGTLGSRSMARNAAMCFLSLIVAAGAYCYRLARSRYEAEEATRARVRE